VVGGRCGELVDQEKVPYDTWVDVIWFCLAHSKIITFLQLVVKQNLIIIFGYKNINKKEYNQ